MVHANGQVLPQLVVIVGPTGVGKSEVAARVAQRLGGEVVSCDAMQVYRELPICTAVPSASVRALAPHHGLEMIERSEEWNVARFVAFATSCIEQIVARQSVPVLVGGNGLYIRSLLDGLCPAPAADWELRRRLLDEVAAGGGERLHQRLASVDAVAASRIHPRNVRRVIRALEVQERSGQLLSEWQRQTAGIVDRYRVAMIGLTASRPLLYRWIDARVEAMVASGLVEEVRCAQQQPMSRTAERVLGVPEIAGYRRGERGLDEAVRLLQRNSRRYAKRQLTWFRTDSRIQWVERGQSDTIDALVDRVLALLSVEQWAVRSAIGGVS